MAGVLEVELDRCDIAGLIYLFNSRKSWRWWENSQLVSKYYFTLQCFARHSHSSSSLAAGFSNRQREHFLFHLSPVLKHLPCWFLMGTGLFLTCTSSCSAGQADIKPSFCPWGFCSFPPLFALNSWAEPQCTVVQCCCCSIFCTFESKHLQSQGEKKPKKPQNYAFYWKERWTFKPLLHPSVKTWYPIFRFSSP